jgi:hypothetical protein
MRSNHKKSKGSGIEFHCNDISEERRKEPETGFNQNSRKRKIVLFYSPQCLEIIQTLGHFFIVYIDETVV